MCAATIIFISLITKQKLDIVISAYLLSFGISYFTYYISSFLSGSTFAIFIGDNHMPGKPLYLNQPIFILMYTIIAILQLLLAFLFFQIRRFRKGFPFIFNKFTIVASLTLTGAILILAARINTIAATEGNIHAEYYLYVAGAIVVGVGIYMLIKRLITGYQIKRAQQSSEAHFERLYCELSEKYERLNEMHKAKQTAIHNITDIIESMRIAVKQGKVTIEDVQNLQNDWQGELSKIKGKRPLPTTNIQTIDSLFEHFKEKLAGDDINLNVIVNGSIPYMVDNVVKSAELKTLIVNHINDAQTAVNSGYNSLRNVMVVIGLTGNCYELTILDSGVPFEVDTLVRLGTERITTHADTGGSGIGFMTTFETMREYGASLIIEEFKPSRTDYSKSVAIRFDGKNQYIVKTYRPGDFPENERYTVLPG